jgi:hypothetical protein
MPYKRELLVIVLLVACGTCHSSFVVAEPSQVHTIKATANVDGGIFPAGTISVAAGGSQAFNITPDPGYRILSVIVDGTNRGAVSTYTFTNIQTNHTIDAYFKPVTYAIKSSADSNGTISFQGVNTVNPKSSMTFTVTADPGYHVADVLVDGDSVGPRSSYTFVNIMANHTIRATFTENPWFIIDASAGPNGSISLSGRGSLLGGTNQKYNITPASGYRIADVIVDGESKGELTSYTFYDIRAPHAITATFTVDVYDIIASVTNYDSSIPARGSITPSGMITVAGGSSQIFTIAPDPDYEVYSVLVDGNQQGRIAAYAFTNIHAGHTIAAYVRPITYTVTTRAGTGGSIDPSGVTTLNTGGSQTFTITPTGGYHIANVTVGPTGGTMVSVGSISSYLVSKIKNNMTIAAVFAPNPSYAITAGAGANGSISPSGSVFVLGGADQKFIIMPNPGYRLNELIIDGTKQQYPRNSYTFYGVQGNHSISASFVLDATLNVKSPSGINDIR